MTNSREQQGRPIVASEIAIFKGFNNSFECFYSKGLMELGVSVLDCVTLEGGSYQSSRLEKVFRLPSTVIQLRKSLKGKRIVIAFEMSSYGALALRLSMSRSCKVAFWHWNAFNSDEDNAAEAVANKIGAVRLTFDHENAAHGRSIAVHQFFPFDYDECVKLREVDKPSRAAFFIGVDKGRWKLLENLSRCLKRCGIICDFHVVSDGSADLHEHPEWVQDGFMPYEDVLGSVNANEFIVDFVKQGQVGMTMRCLEALQFSRKIITNNRLLLDPLVWNPNNVLYTQDGHIDNEELISFIEKPYDSSKDKDLKAKYSMRDWLKHIVLLTTETCWLELSDDLEDRR